MSDNEAKLTNPVERSIATSNDGNEQPGSILPIADAKHGGNVQTIGFMYRGNGYGHNSSWITCEKDDLYEITR